MIVDDSFPAEHAWITDTLQREQQLWWRKSHYTATTKRNWPLNSSSRFISGFFYFYFRCSEGNGSVFPTIITLPGSWISCNQESIIPGSNAHACGHVSYEERILGLYRCILRWATGTTGRQVFNEIKQEDLLRFSCAWCISISKSAMILRR